VRSGLAPHDPRSKTGQPTVLVLTPDFPPEIGGIQTLVLRVAKGLTHFRPLVVTIAAEGAHEFDGQQPFRVVRSPAPIGHRSGVLTLNAVGALEGVRSAPSVILSAHIVAGPAAIALGRLLGRPVVQHAHAQELGRRKRLAGYVLNRAQAVIASSGYTKELVDTITGGNANVRVVHPGVDCASEPPTPTMKHSTIVVVARLTERYKGHDILLRALPLVRRHIKDAQLHVVGDGELRPELERLADMLKVSSATTFHGTVTDTERDAILAGATVFAMPSRLQAHGRGGEGFGIVYIEASAHGIPVLAGNVGGSRDAVIDGKTGLLVNPDNPQAVADGLVTILQDPEAARRMGRAGWEHARTLSWARTAAGVEAVLNEVRAK
jgi:phosphatidyl-myo-inositol dimannoside synthase